ncbi:MAG: chromosome segregation protein SMC [Phycisphaerae bacterium]
MKLAKLIVSGFKSFADRTEFEFDDGISCIVGPNGCGKSNVVDAVKWVLGEQSAKSLRGSEMMDVLFNGSSQRRSAGSAEVTLVFENGDGVLQPPEAVKKDDSGKKDNIVSITRRLYRSGQSEYLINKVPARLKDIREMFFDTGVGNNAYGVIEQGQVEGFLQASHEERRKIFDEAAGISKYKARKKEALRKLDRVEQNLLRVTDVLAEVEKRLRSIKYQAGKARNYQTYSERLAELRSLHSLAKYHTQTRQRHALQEKLDAAHDRASGINAKINKLESTRSSTEVEAVDLERTARQLQGEVATIGGQITSAQQRSDMLTARVKELGDQIVQLSRRGEELEAKIEQVDSQIETRGEELARSEAQAEQLAAQYEQKVSELREQELAIGKLTADLEDRKAGTIDLMRQVSQLNNQAQAAEIRRENLAAQKQRLWERREQIDESLCHLAADRVETESKLTDARRRLSDANEQLTAARERSQQLVTDEHELQSQLSEARETRSAAISRINALEEMQKRMEGVAAGVRKVMKARQEGKLTQIRGMLGETVTADADRAAWVEAALAGADQTLLLDRLSDLHACHDELNEVLGDGGAVELLCLDRTSADRPAIPAHPAVLGCVADWVRGDDDVAAGIASLLGRTLAVNTLAEAESAAADLPGEWRFVTGRGELLEPDGRVRIGAASRGTGMISRRTELAELETARGKLDAAIESLQDRCQATRSRREESEEAQQTLRNTIYQANTERVEHESHLSGLTDQIDRLQREAPLVTGEIEGLDEDIATAADAQKEALAKAARLEADSARRQEEIDELTETIASHRRTLEGMAEAMTDLKVSLAQAREKQVSAREAVASLQRQRDQMSEDLTTARDEVELSRRRRTDAEQAITTAGEEVDALYEKQTALQQELEDVEESRKGLSEKLDEIRRELQTNRKAHDEAGESLSGIKVQLNEADVRIETLMSRASEELGMDLVELYESYEHDTERDWDAVEAEINDLRTKISRLGNVNLDAITEQEELEKRREFLAQQIEDITHSRDQLDELIRRINKDSKELFLQTFADVRENFQTLFRKLFGGGRADVILLDPEDVLECGIEIVARPPGKELRSLSLLSGGEKTMTALSLLFSIFKSRPSPFCLLDEVDAALDEANTERFSRLVKEFVELSQFIVITHAKRTMAAADVLYGVTMEEAGVSKRISVRFEEVAAGEHEELETAGAS